MGAHAYWYFTPYQPDVGAALELLRQQEFAAGRYSPATRFIKFPIDGSAPSIGAQHDSIDDALLDADADGTRSILDITEIGDEPFFGTAGPLANEALIALFKTTQPTRKMIEENMGIFGQIERGQAIYIIVYREGVPDELFFAGYSFD
jgi:hypothetical protein